MNQVEIVFMAVLIFQTIVTIAAFILWLYLTIQAYSTTPDECPTPPTSGTAPVLAVLYTGTSSSDISLVSPVPSNKALLITGCSDPMMWYAKMIGSIVPLDGHDVLEKHYWSREVAGFRNVVLCADAEIVQVEV